MLPAHIVTGQKHKSDNEANSRASWNTPRSDSRSGLSYGSRMALSFALTSLMTVLILVCVIMVVWGSAFSEYTRANVIDLAKLTSEKLADSYEQDGEWTVDTLYAIAQSSSISDDIGLQVLDAEGTILYDDTWPVASVAADVKKSEAEPVPDTGSAEEGSVVATDQGSAGQAAATSAEGSATAAEEDEPKIKFDRHGLISTAPTDEEGAITEPITTSDGKVVGKVRLWVLGSDVLLTKTDTAFREKTIDAMFLAAAIAVAISVMIGLFVSRMLTNPIRRITGTAKQIRDGDLSARTNMRGDDEIDQLGETFDEMATSLEKDLKHERRLTSDVAHELRTPLMAMLATVEAMQDGVYPTDNEHLETVASETRRLARLVQQMLDLSRMENHTAPMNIEAVDMVELVRGIVNAQEPLFHERDLRLRFADETQGKMPFIKVDPDMITQCVINLMSNAMRYTPEGGWVIVTVGLDRKHLTISVSDTGIGIAKEDLSRIFGRFWRADASRAREAGGLGVGLAVTKQIVERHHGFISVESELEKGTTFTIHLPREQQQQPSSTTIER
ncbi:ATP-binding protein [Collinsella bouchesdurhonensis]|uniref:HAMP domain-containing sensor histidine kinase n=1 Tax=Collinsella bouchesdurhonensis TaxID=1907654 RepID=UPI002A7CB97B|nr:HAMP domain-containing histidine kinase [Collinsella bouchesdurhonensis]MDY3053638.1 HAMP domain-containing sensor histidine kinase [Collinsella bouchesdurhonensis]